MKKLTRKWQMFIYGCAGMGVNMLNLLMGSYLVSALYIGNNGFSEAAIPFQTYAQKDLIIVGIWSALFFVAKIIDGVIDIPMASLTDNLKTKWGRRRPALLMGLVPLVLSFLAFLAIPENKSESMLNTWYYWVVLCVFYVSYTLTMVTYYATFTEIVETEEERNYISNVKSVCDIVYFILGYVGVAAMLKGINVRFVALICLPLVLTMLIPMFMIKEDSSVGVELEKEKSVNVIKSLAYTLRNKDFILWMIVYMLMTFGVQLFLGGINEYFSVADMNMVFVMAAAFAPVPATLLIYNALIRKKGFRFAFQYVLLVFSLGMAMIFGVSFLEKGILRTMLSVLSGIICSLGIGALFSVAYSIPSQLAADDEKRTGISHSAMYFAVQGLFSGVATGLGSGVILNLLKGTDGVRLIPVLAAAGCVAAFFLTYILPKSIVDLGKKTDK